MAFKILLTDDEPFMRKSIIRELKGLDVEITEKENGLDALTALLSQDESAEPFNLLITDNEMPELKGLELIEQVKKHGLNIPIILISGTLKEIDVPEGVIFIAKPWSVKDKEGKEHDLLKEQVELFLKEAQK